MKTEEVERWDSIRCGCISRGSIWTSSIEVVSAVLGLRDSVIELGLSGGDEAVVVVVVVTETVDLVESTYRYVKT